MNTYLKPNDLVISMKGIGSEIMVTEVVPRYEYRDGKKTDKVIGKYANGYLLSVIAMDFSTGKRIRKQVNAPIKIKMHSNDDSLKIGVGRVCGTFIGEFFGKWYWTGKRYALSCWGTNFVSGEKMARMRKDIEKEGGE